MKESKKPKEPTIEDLQNQLIALNEKAQNLKEKKDRKGNANSLRVA